MALYLSSMVSRKVLEGNFPFGNKIEALQQGDLRGEKRILRVKNEKKTEVNEDPLRRNDCIISYCHLLFRNIEAFWRGFSNQEKWCLDELGVHLVSTTQRKNGMKLQCGDLLTSFMWTSLLQLHEKLFQ